MKTDYPDPEALRRQAQQLAASAQSVSDASEYPRLALGAVSRQVEAMNELASSILDNGSLASAKRPGMTGEERRERRAAILRIRAARLKLKAANLHRHAHDIGSRIPFGQPVLVGHHSERGHRRAIDRMHNATGQAIGADNYADALQTRAANVERNGAILNSDSDALEQLRAKLAAEERQQTHMRLVNKAHAAYLKNPARLAEFDLPADWQTRIKTYVPRYSWEPHPIAPYMLTNLGANIRRIRQRITELEARQGKQDTESELHGVRIAEDYTADRLRLYFSGKPAEAIRRDLKSHGFRWSPTEGAWQRQLNESAKYWAEELLRRHFAPQPASVAA